MTMKDLRPNIFGDYQHLVDNTIERWGGEPDFPKADDAFRKKLDDYLFDYQSILDSEGSQKSQLTKYGIITIIPIVILSAFPENMTPWGKYTLFVGLGMGLAISLAIKGLYMFFVRSKIRSLKKASPVLADYSERVLSYRKSKLGVY